MDTPELQWRRHDARLPARAMQAIDDGLHDFNIAAAPPILNVAPLACTVRRHGRLLGGARGRTWGECAELQQLWVAEACRRQGLGRRLVREFEAAAKARGVRRVYLETFSFQAPQFYAALGYRVGLEIAGFGPGIRKFTLLREL